MPIIFMCVCVYVCMPKMQTSASWLMFWLLLFCDGFLTRFKLKFDLQICKVYRQKVPFLFIDFFLFQICQKFAKFIFVTYILLYLCLSEFVFGVKIEKNLLKILNVFPDFTKIWRKFGRFWKSGKFKCQIYLSKSMAWHVIFVLVVIEDVVKMP